MQRRGKKMRDFRFGSQKGGGTLITHSLEAKRYADWLEAHLNVTSYECCVPLDRDEYIYVSPLGIRKQYFSLDWETDFLIHCDDGQERVRELVCISDMLKDATLEQLEFSRRYWAGRGVTDWKIVLIMEE